MGTAHGRFERWRKSHRGRLPIPDALWRAAAELAKEHGVFRTAKVLRFDYTKLKAWLRAPVRTGSPPLEGQEGRLFHPLAYAKNLAMLVAALLTITLDPALRLTLAGLGLRDWGHLMSSALRGKIRREEHHSLSRWLTRIYQPALEYALLHKGLVATVVLAAAVGTVPVYRRLGAEFVPPLDEGVLLYMPSTVSAISITEAKRLLQLTGARLKSLPEVAHVLGKAGRADTSTDVAPLSMLETVVVLKPREQWPCRMTQPELIAKFDGAMRFPGVANAWTMPVRGRIDMLATGMRSPLGLKIAGPEVQRSLFIR
jgi:copper/silver efflux system protein